MVPRTIEAPRPQLRSLPPPPPDPFDRLRAALGSGREAEELVDSLREELKREYERGYHDGWASTKRPARRGPGDDRLSRRGRRWRRAWRSFTANVAVRKVALLVVVMTVSLLGAMAGLHLANASHDSKYAPPPANPM